MDDLITLLLLPAASALLLLLLPSSALRHCRTLAVLSALLTFCYTLWLGLGLDFSNPAIQLSSQQAWNTRLGTYFALGIDGFPIRWWC
ncbi:MAG: hypothetical protein R3E95_04235 [Thiolinea sp.]